LIDIWEEVEDTIGNPASRQDGAKACTTTDSMVWFEEPVDGLWYSLLVCLILVLPRTRRRGLGENQLAHNKFHIICRTRGSLCTIILGNMWWGPGFLVGGFS